MSTARRIPAPLPARPTISRRIDTDDDPVRDERKLEQCHLELYADCGGADRRDAVLTFLAWGDEGSATNLPPTVFLEGVNTTPLPEPSTLAMIVLGFLGMPLSAAGSLEKRAVATA